MKLLQKFVFVTVFIILGFVAILFKTRDRVLTRDLGQLC